MKKILLLFALALPFGQAKADFWGADVAVLGNILVQAMAQLAQLKEILGTAQENIELIKEINRGINDSLNLLEQLQPNLDPGIYKDWKNVTDGLRKMQRIYGEVADSPEAQVQRDTDQEVVEAVTFNNAFFKRSKEIDEIGDQIKSESHNASPAGAQKLTAQALGIIIQILNENLRAQATSLKLQGQSLATQNRKDKEETRFYLSTTKSLTQSMTAEKAAFRIPRF